MATHRSAGRWSGTASDLPLGAGAVPVGFCYRPYHDTWEAIYMRPDGQLDHYETEVRFEFKQPKRNMYRHLTCGGYTFCGEPIALTYATNPGFYTHTYCATCRTHLPLVEFVWEPDGCPMHEVRGEPGQDLTLPLWWRPPVPLSISDDE